MSTDSKNQPTAPGLASAIALCAEEIERLKVELELIRSGDHPERRAMMIDRVTRIDERQDALDKMRASAAETKSP